MGEVKYCQHCPCDGCVKARKKQIDDFIHSVEVKKRKEAKEDAKEATRVLTIREKHFSKVKFKQGYQSIHFNSPSIRRGDLSVRSLNILIHNEIYRVSDLLDTSEWRLLRKRNMGKKSLEEMLEFLRKGIDTK